MYPYYKNNQMPQKVFKTGMIDEREGHVAETLARKWEKKLQKPIIKLMP